MHFLLLRAEFSHEGGQQTSLPLLSFWLLDLWITGQAPHLPTLFTLAWELLWSGLSTEIFIISDTRNPRNIKYICAHSVSSNLHWTNWPFLTENQSWNESLWGPKSGCGRFNVVFEDFLRRGHEHQPSPLSSNAMFRWETHDCARQEKEIRQLAKGYI